MYASACCLVSWISLRIWQRVWGESQQSPVLHCLLHSPSIFVICSSSRLPRPAGFSAASNWPCQTEFRGLKEETDASAPFYVYCSFSGIVCPQVLGASSALQSLQWLQTDVIISCFSSCLSSKLEMNVYLSFLNLRFFLKLGIRPGCISSLTEWMWEKVKQDVYLS